MEEPIPQEDCEEPNLESYQMVDDLFEKVYFKLKSGLEDLIHQKVDEVLIQAIAPLKDMFEGTTSELSKKLDSLNRRVSVLEETEFKIAPHENDNVREATLFQKEIEKLTDDLSTSKKLLEEQERYLRRNNVILVGFPENPNENLKEDMGTILSDKLKIPS